MLEETEAYRKIVEDVSGGSDVDVERKMRHWANKLQERRRRSGMWNQMGGRSKKKRERRAT